MKSLNGRMTTSEDFRAMIRVGVADTYLIVYSKQGGDVLSLTPDKMRQIKKLWKQYKKAMKNVNRPTSESNNTVQQDGSQHPKRVSPDCN